MIIIIMIACGYVGALGPKAELILVCAAKLGIRVEKVAAHPGGIRFSAGSSVARARGNPRHTTRNRRSALSQSSESICGGATGRIRRTSLWWPASVLA